VVELVEVRLAGATGRQVERDVDALLDELRPSSRGTPGPVPGATWQGGFQAYVEIPVGPNWRCELPEALAAISAIRGQVRAEAGQGPPPGAKLRCGGLSADAFPSPAAVACFIAVAAAQHVPMKATAGLHQPLRHTDPATGITHHGFLNLLGAAVLAHALAVDEDALVRLLSETTPEAFTLTADGFGWRGLGVDPAAIIRARAELFTSYGSCSLSEPVDGLRGLGILPLPARR
jgi:hypothetical protein